MAGCTPGYFNMEGLMDKMPKEVQAKMTRHTIWAGSLREFTAILEEWRGSMEGLEVSVVA
jgi:hypothetical protein